jgi:hypothetical protein
LSPHSVPQWLARRLKALKTGGGHFILRYYADVMQTLCTHYAPHYAQVLSL